MTTFELIATVVGALVGFFSVGGLGYKVVVYWRKAEREAGRAEQYKESSTETIEDLRERLRRAEAVPHRCHDCVLWNREGTT